MAFLIRTGAVFAMRLDRETERVVAYLYNDESGKSFADLFPAMAKLVENKLVAAMKNIAPSDAAAAAEAASLRLKETSSRIIEVCLSAQAEQKVLEAALRGGEDPAASEERLRSLRGEEAVLRAREPILRDQAAKLAQTASTDVQNREREFLLARQADAAKLVAQKEREIEAAISKFVGEWAAAKMEETDAQIMFESRRRDHELTTIAENRRAPAPELAGTVKSSPALAGTPTERADRAQRPTSVIKPGETRRTPEAIASGDPRRVY